MARALELEPATGRALTVCLPDGRLGFYQRREDDCMRAAVATLLQVPISDVPDPRIDERLAAGEDPAAINARAGGHLERWLDGRGLRLTIHRQPPLGRDGWLGCSLGEGRFNDHVVVMAGSRIVFDPAANWPVPPGVKVAPVTAISHGITFDERPSL